MKIGEVSRKHGISTDTLRYYEKVGLIPSVNRNESGIRDYTEADIKRIEFIKCMRNAGLHIEALTKYMNLVIQGDKTIEARKEILQDQRDLLAAHIQNLQKTLDLLDYKISVYEEALLKKEQEMVQEIAEV